MKVVFRVGLAAHHIGAALAGVRPQVLHDKLNVTYYGLERNGVEVFLGIPYGQATGGANRFRPPRPHMPAPGSVVDARAYGASCPQQLGTWVPPVVQINITNISEDCLNLNVARPGEMRDGDRLPVMVFNFGGGFWRGSAQEPTCLPDGLILESVRNGQPVIHVAMNYRLGVFGFAQSDALRCEGSENAGLRDQRLALEWVRDNIEQFGGDPNRVTLFGQSSGGLGVGMQIMAYGASVPAPFQQAIFQSHQTGTGITKNITIKAMQDVVDRVGCNGSLLHSNDTVACLRQLDTEMLLNASLAAYALDGAQNAGGIWLPAVDGDFLPAAPSTLAQQGRFAHVPIMSGWTEDDAAHFIPRATRTPADTRDVVSAYAPGLAPTSVDALLALYPVSDFRAQATPALSAEFFRAARVMRDLRFTCPSVWYGRHMARAGKDAYLYDWNQTILGDALGAGLGVVHTSELAYVFGNLSHYNVSGFAFDPSPADYALAVRGSRSWSTFAATGKPGLDGHDTFQGWTPAFREGHKLDVFVAGGPVEGLSSVDGSGARDGVCAQKLRERCAFINSPDIIDQLGF